MATKIRRFDTRVQHLKYKVLREVAKEAWEGNLEKNLLDLPKRIVVGNKPTMRCCVYKERAIAAERVKLAMGGDEENPNVIEVIDIACDECPIGGFEVTNACRGCLAHRCVDACKFDAITIDENYEAHIDKSKCKECGACAKACPYGAIIKRTRPCQNACKVNAISINDDLSAKINNEVCISCGACVYMCPFGAINDKSYIVKVIDFLKNKKSKVCAVVAPAISGQFTYAKVGQVITGLKKLGFDIITEAALGADMVAKEEAAELAEKGFLTSSCCPAFVEFVGKTFPDIKENISHNLSPMATVSKFIKESIPDAKVVFVGPCTAKKMEIKKEEVKPYVDAVITFEELQALFDSKEIDIAELEETALDGASYYGRIFARCGGLADAVVESLKEQGIEDFELKAVSCNGIEECKIALLKHSKGVLGANFIEGMACEGGCIGGAGCLTHHPKNRVFIDNHGKEAGDKTILESVSKAKI